MHSNGVPRIGGDLEHFKLLQLSHKMRDLWNGGLFIAYHQYSAFHQ